MRYFFEPRAVAIVGASSVPGKIGYEVLRSIVESGYRGAVYPINPNQTQILNLKTYPSLSQTPKPVDLAVIILTARAVPEAIKECGQAGVKGAVVISGGFRELGGEGVEIEKALVAVARQQGVRVIGPNCIGVLNSRNKLDTFFQPRDCMTRPQEGSVALLTESGTYGLALLEWLAEEGLGVSKFVSYGNKCDVSELDLLPFLAHDPDTQVIALYMEGTKDGAAFLKVAREVSRVKPVVLLKAGRTASGARAARSHTGALAGNFAVFAAAAARSGVLLADDLEQMFDVVKVLTMQPLPRGGAIAMVTNGAGPCVVAADAIEESRGVSLAKLSPKTVKVLQESFPPFFIVQNPVDVTGSGEASHYLQALQRLGEDPGVDILLPFFAMQDAPLAYTVDQLLDSLESLQAFGKTFIASAAGGEFTRAQGRKFQERGIPFIPTARRAITALDKVVAYARWRAEPGLRDCDLTV